jgi:hypothetical protein
LVKKDQKSLSHRIVCFLSAVLILQVISSTASFALQEGGKCNYAKYGNSLAMSNGAIHGGSFGPNKNYSGALYLCDGGVWVYWKMATPPASPKKTVNVRSMQACSKLGQQVQSTSEGTLVCRYVMLGRLRALVWTQK